MIRDKHHLEFIRDLPCCKCLKCPSDPAHIRIGTDGGTGLKPSDCWVVPLCRECHSKQHMNGERTFWGPYLDRAKDLAADLYLKTGDEDKGCLAVVRFQNAFFT